MQTQLYAQVQQKCADSPDSQAVQMLNEGYSRCSNGLITREVRFVLEKCLTVEVRSCLSELNTDEEQLALALSHPDCKVKDFFENFKAKLKEHFARENDILAKIMEGGPECEIRLQEVEDRFNRVMSKYSSQFSGNSFSEARFLIMIKEVLTFESDFVNASTEQLQSSVSRKRYCSSTLSTSSNGIVAHKLARISQLASSQELKNILGSLKAVCLTKDRVCQLIDDVRKLQCDFLTLSHRVSAINNSLASQNFLALNEEAPLDSVHRNCQQSGMLETVSVPMRQLLKNSLLITKQSDQVIQVGSGTAAKYLKLDVRTLFSKFFQEAYGVEPRRDLRIAILSAEMTQQFESFSASQLCDLELASRALLETKPVCWKDNVASISLRFKERPPSTSGPKSTQAFAICVFYLTDGGRLLNEETAVATLSKPISFITSDNQRSEATAAIQWYCLTEPLYPLRACAPQPKSVDDLVRLIQTYVKEETKQELNKESIAYFRSKCTQLSSRGMVAFNDFLKKALIGKVVDRACSLWKFVFSCVKFIKDRNNGCHSLFEAGIVYGFVTTERAEMILSDVAESLSHDLALLRFSETTATVTLAVRRRLETKHEVPKPKNHFDSVSVAEFCYTLLQLSDRILTTGGAIISVQDLKSYIPTDSIIPGYVALSREFDLLSIVSRDPSEMDFDILAV